MACSPRCLSSPVVSTSQPSISTRHTNVYNHPHSFLDYCGPWSVCPGVTLSLSFSEVSPTLHIFDELWKKLLRFMDHLPLSSQLRNLFGYVSYILVNNILAQVYERKELYFQGFNSCASFWARNKVTWWRIGLFLMLRLNILQLI